MNYELRIKLAGDEGAEMELVGILGVIEEMIETQTDLNVKSIKFEFRDHPIDCQGRKRASSN